MTLKIVDHCEISVTLLVGDLIDADLLQSPYFMAITVTLDDAVEDVCHG